MIPNEKRVVAVIGSKPTVAINSPPAADNRPFIRVLPETAPMVVSEKTISIEYSGGPNFNAILAR